jgi:intracellular septation protein A
MSVTPAPAAPTRAAATAPARRPSVRSSVVPLLIDVGVPVGGFYLLHDGFGLSTWLALALSGVVPAARAVGGLVIERRLNLLAALMAVVNAVGIAVTFATGDPRLMLAKESVVSSVIAIAILASVVARRPMMTAGLRPFLTRGQGSREAAWDRLAAGSARFRRLELLFSIVWGVVLLADCAVRLAGALTLPVSTMVWLGTVLTISAIAVASIVSGIVTGPMIWMLDRTAAEPDPSDAGSGRAQ